MNTALWAKKSDHHSRLEWLPLSQHLLDTMYISGLLWEHWLSEGQKSLFLQSIRPSDEEIAKSLVMFLAAVHDIGKATPAFQLQHHPNNSEDLHHALLEQLEKSGFTGISTIKLASPQKTHHSIAGEVLLNQYGVADDIASIVGAHHGKPIDEAKTCEIQWDSYPANYFQVESASDPVHRLWKKTQREIFDWALEMNHFKTVKNLPTIEQPAQVLCSGLLIMADWIASNENYFPLIPLAESNVVDVAKRIERGWLEWFRTEAWQAMYPMDAKQYYESRFRFSPRSVQQVFFETIEGCKQPGLFILEAPMGKGKTEASLAGVEQLAQSTGRSGLFFGLPTQATSNGVFPRIHEWLESIVQESGDSFSIRLHHGKSALNEEFREISRNIDMDTTDGTVLVNEWFAGRKTAALDDFVVGTVDQFLLAALKQKHLALRHLGFSKKVVVIDEVHAYDAYMSQYLLEAIRWMGAYEVPMIILSATLPAERREKIVQEYMGGRGFKKREIRYLQKDMKTDAYPLITYTDGDMVNQIREFEKEKGNTIYIKALEEDQLLPKLGKLLQGGGNVGIIVNTVKRAQKIAGDCIETFGAEMVEVLHSGFIATHRLEKEQQLMKLVGKNAKRPYQKIIIGTQVMEQSLDIDFDVLITDLSPMDLLIQRIGRLHRHTIDRPSQHVTPVTYVMGMSETLEFESGAKAIYGDYLLARTQFFLPQELHIPEDISVFVQKVYGDQKIAFCGDLWNKYEKAEIEYRTNLEEKEKRARTFRIDKPRKSSQYNLIGWLKNNTQNETEEKAYAQVRDSEETIEVIAVQKVGDGYGVFGSDEDISEQIEDFYVAKKLAQQTIKLPRIFTNYSEKTDQTIKTLENLRKDIFPSWEKQSWLKGELGLLFDQEKNCCLNGIELHYDEIFGLSYNFQKMEE